MAAGQPLKRTPHSLKKSVFYECLLGVIRTTGLETARTRQYSPERPLIQGNQAYGYSSDHLLITEAFSALFPSTSQECPAGLTAHSFTKTLRPFTDDFCRCFDILFHDIVLISKIGFLL